LLTAWSGEAARLPQLRARAGLRFDLVVNTTHLGDGRCHAMVKVTANDSLSQRCPEQCPLYASNAHDKLGCNFACVEASSLECVVLNPKTPVVDLEQGMCRRCRVFGCDTCRSDGSDRCETCLEGYELGPKGQCALANPWFAGYCCIIAGLVILGIAVVVVVMWVVDLSRRDITNAAGLEHSLHVRSRAKLHRPTEQGAERELWPLDTNLCTTNVAGPAVVLLFNFQAAVIIWALVMALGWFVLAAFIDWDLLILGTKTAETARQGCIIVKWGYESQHRLMYAKVGYLAFEYAFSFGGAVLFGIRQWRLHKQHHFQDSAHSHFCVVLRGLPSLPGDRMVEQELAAAVETATRVKPVGVSVGWEAGSSFGDFEVAAEYMLHITCVERVMQGTFEAASLEIGGMAREMQEESLVWTKVGVESFARYGLQDAPASGSRVTVAQLATFEAKGIEVGMLFEQGDLALDPPASGCIPPQLSVDAAGKHLFSAEDAVTEARADQRLHRSFLRAAFLAVEELFLHSTTQKFLSRGRRMKAFNAQKKREEGNKKKRFLQRSETSKHTLLVGGVADLDEELLVKELQGLTSSSWAFVVCETESDRDDMLATLETTPLEFAGATLRAAAAHYEPNAVLWGNLTGHDSIAGRAKSVVGIALVVTVTFLGLFEYMYYRVQLNNVYATGEEAVNLSFILSTILVALVMAGLCVVAAEISDRAGFVLLWRREMCFVLIYTFSVMMQVSLDLVIAYWVGKRLMEVKDMRLYDGTLLKHLRTDEDFTQIWEAYAMQKQLGVTVLSFGFPCAFLLPFVAEPFMSIYLPYKIMCLIVRSHPEVKGRSAEDYLEALAMDLSRYGDIMINAIVGALILWFPGGFTLTIFLFLAGSHIYIYVYDHFRVLRSINSIYIATFKIDWWAQWLFSIPCALILSALVMKANCEDYLADHYPSLERLGLHGTHCDRGYPLVFKCSFFFIAHVILHTLVLCCIVHTCGKGIQGKSEATYSQTARLLPCSWFSANPIHCLRSQFIYLHAPAQDFCVNGKEHLMRSNPAIGAHFTARKAEIERFDTPIGEALTWTSRARASQEVP